MYETPRPAGGSAPAGYVPTAAEWAAVLPRIDLAVHRLKDGHVPDDDVRAYAAAHVVAKAPTYDPSRASWSDFVGANGYYGAVDGVRAEVGKAQTPRRQGTADAVRGEAYDVLVAALPDPESDAPDAPLTAALEAARLEGALRRLDERTAYVVRETYLEGRLVCDVAEDLGVHKTRVSQIRTEALAELRGLLSPDEFELA